MTNEDLITSLREGYAQKETENERLRRQVFMLSNQVDQDAVKITNLKAQYELKQIAHEAEIGLLKAENEKLKTHIRNMTAEAAA